MSEGPEVYHRSTGGRRVTAFGINVNLPPAGPQDHGRRRRVRRTRKAAGIAGLVGSISITGAFATGWVFMLVVGALYHEFGWLRPIGFWPSLGLAAGFIVLASVVRSGGVNVGSR